MNSTIVLIVLACSFVIPVAVDTTLYGGTASDSSYDGVSFLHQNPSGEGFVYGPYIKN